MKFFIPFFTPEDFECGRQYTQAEFANLANTKLDREGKVVYGLDQQWRENNVWKEAKKKALLINIAPLSPKKTYEELEKELFVLKTQNEVAKLSKKMVERLNCTHPKEKVNTDTCLYSGKPCQYVKEPAVFKCECGARVQVKQDGFEVCE